MIKQAALALFAERGVDAVSVRDIAAACAMKPSNLYAHFASRDALVGELFHEGYADYGALLAAIAGGGGPFHARLDLMVREICGLHDRDHARFRFLIMTQHGFLRDVPDGDGNPVDVLCRMAAAAMDSGDIPRRDAGLMALAVIGLIVQPATGLLYGRLTGGLLERADAIAGLCLRALS